MNKYVIAGLNAKGIGQTKLLNFFERNSFEIDRIKSNFNDFIGNDAVAVNLLNQAEEEIKLNKSSGIKLITMFDNQFPDKLIEFKTPILHLYYIGNIELLSTPSIGIVGTRKPNKSTIDNTNLFIDNIKQFNLTVISGLALGVDTITHKRSLKNKLPTIAVLPSSLNDIYPKSNEDLSKEILLQGGCLVSEYPINSKLNKYNYVLRNRIQSALSDILVVPEAKENSGTVTTVNYSLKNNKQVFQFLENDLKMIKNKLSVDEVDQIEKLVLEIKKTNMLKERKDQIIQTELF